MNDTRLTKAEMDLLKRCEGNNVYDVLLKIVRKLGMEPAEPETWTMYATRRQDGSLIGDGSGMPILWSSTHIVGEYETVVEVECRVKE